MPSRPGSRRLKRCASRPTERFSKGRATSEQEASLKCFGCLSSSRSPRPSLSCFCRFERNGSERVRAFSGTIASCGREPSAHIAMTSVHLSPGNVTLELLRDLWARPVAFALDSDARARVDAAARTIAGIVAEGRVVYGVNTGFGLLARTRIDAARVSELQRALVLSHSAGTGTPLDDVVVRLTLLLKIASVCATKSSRPCLRFSTPACSR